MAAAAEDAAQIDHHGAEMFGAQPLGAPTSVHGPRADADGPETLPRPRRRGQARLELGRARYADKNHDFAVLDTPKDPAWAGLLEKGRQNIDVLVNDEHVTTLDFHDGFSVEWRP